MLEAKRLTILCTSCVMYAGSLSLITCVHSIPCLFKHTSARLQKRMTVPFRTLVSTLM